MEGFTPGPVGRHGDFSALLRCGAVSGPLAAPNVRLPAEKVLKLGKKSSGPPATVVAFGSRQKTSGQSSQGQFAMKKFSKIKQIQPSMAVKPREKESVRRFDAITARIRAKNEIVLGLAKLFSAILITGIIGGVLNWYSLESKAREHDQEMEFKKLEAANRVQMEQLKFKSETRARENDYFGKYVEIATGEILDRRIRLAQYFKNVTTDPDLKMGWESWLEQLGKEQITLKGRLAGREKEIAELEQKRVEALANGRFEEVTALNTKIEDQYKSVDYFATELNLKEKIESGQTRLITIHKAYQPIAYPNVWGLFIGVDKYRNFSNLSNCASGTRAIVECFIRNSKLRDPEVLLDEGANRQNIISALERIGRKRGPDDLFIFYFAGHGLGFESGPTSESYLLLADADNDLKTISKGAIQSSELVQLIGTHVRVKHKIAILDACNAGTLAQQAPRTRVVSRYTIEVPAEFSGVLAEQFSREGFMVCTAGASDQEVLDIGNAGAGDKGGVFTESLIDVIDRPESHGMARLQGRSRCFLLMDEIMVKTRGRASKSSRLILIQYARQLFSSTGIDMSDDDLVVLLETNGLPAGLPDGKIDDFNSIQNLYRNIPIPKYHMLEGQGIPMIPVNCLEDSPTPPPTPVIANPAAPSITTR